MRVLQVITSLQTGGAETLVSNMIPRLRVLGHIVDICLFNGMDTPLLRIQKEILGVKIHVLGSSYYNPFYIVKLTKIMRRYDVIHTHNSSPQLFVAIANKFCHKKIVTTEHSTNNRKRGHKFFRFVDKWMYRQYDTVICISDIAKKKLEEYLGVESHVGISIIYNGVDVTAFYRAMPLDRKDIGSDKSKFVMVMVAGFREAKDQDTLIKAMARLPKDCYELWLVGDGVRKDELKRLIHTLKLENSIKLLGVRIDVPNILKAANVVVMSSHWEGLSLSNIEGMSVGKPFVASDVDGLREMTKGAGILFQHGDDKELANIIARLHYDHQFYQQTADACYQKARQFDISETVAQYDNIYRKL